MNDRKFPIEQTDIDKAIQTISLRKQKKQKTVGQLALHSMFKRMRKVKRKPMIKLDREMNYLDRQMDYAIAKDD